MNAFDRIIGYPQIKEELQQISDTLKNREVYTRMGLSTPRGLLLWGQPGVGKTLMASAVIEDSGLKAYTCRKDCPDGDFILAIRKVFEEAAENAPSIVFLDDLDKFSNSNEERRDTEEYVTVQSCIDALKGKEVFVLATANEIGRLPRSLRRAGRFSRRIRVFAPEGKDAASIITYYLSKNKLTNDIDCKAITSILSGHSCAELETVINQAGLYAGFERANAITMKHFLAAYLRTIIDVPSAFPGEAADENGVNESLRQVIYHEAGHAVVSEVLRPQSVSLLFVCQHYSELRGYTNYDINDCSSVVFSSESHIIIGLGGRAAVEQKLGVTDMGCAEDLCSVFNRVRDLVTEQCVCGLALHEAEPDESEHLRSHQEQAVAAEVERYYRKAREILAENSDFLEKLADALAKKRILTAEDIQRIKSQCTVVPVAI